MAYLNEKNQLVGRVGNLIFRIVKGKVIVQARPDYTQLKQTKSTQKSALDFGTASKITNKLNSGLQEIVQAYHSPEMYNRMRSKILQAMRTHTALPLGEKNLWEGTPELLEGFEFNRESQYKDFSDLWLVNWQVDAQNKIHFTQKSFIPRTQLHWLPYTGRIGIGYWIGAFQQKDYKPCQQQLLTLEVSPNYTEVPVHNFVSTSFPSNTLIIVITTLLYYKQDPVLGDILLNHKQCHPARILKVFKVE
ncbi:hypothetical protein [Mesonia maritima]|uniref:Uncharacterized protein n=1 Tax=Mesonia maritima TaxID=1793873 RepID=A0ABU1K879_9FLAO|nr:hypothetical protein [Mesonia maritima]MDR6301818.1 hypothetical protein [Mesonia maritima]